jgi:catechol 2,3-dioxygenase-like lactoylglutathione lyase family enzyme
MITLRRIDHVGLRVAELEEATERWALQFGLTIRDATAGGSRLACDDEPYAIELLASEPVGLDHVAYELAAGYSLSQARVHLETFGADVEEKDGALRTADADGNSIVLLPCREPASRLVAHARPAGSAPVGHPRRLGHVNFLTGNLHEQLRFYSDGLGMRITDWLGEEGVWLHIGTDHHVMALVEKGYPHFHHLALELVDIGQMRDLLDHLGRHRRWLGWGPVRHGIGGNIASYVRIVEEECFVELYCDMEQLQPDHQVRHWPDDRYSSNTWGPLPPRSYFRFDVAAIESERESLEMRGVPLPPPPSQVEMSR